MKNNLKIPVIVERAVSFSISDLKRIGLFKKGETYLEMPIAIKTTTGFGKTINTIQVAVSTQEGNRYIRLAYSVDGVEITYSLPLVRIKSNLSTGGWLFYCLCPVSNRRCRKLFLVGRYFVGIRSIENSFYAKQVISKGRRAEFQLMAKVHACEKIIRDRTKNYWMVSYDGSLTKRQIRLMKAKAELEGISKAFQ